MFSLLGEHFIAILVIAVVNMLIGFLWYHPSAFGKVWLDAHGFSMDGLKGAPKDYGLAFAVAFVVSWVMGGLFNHFGVDSIFGGWYTMFWVWLGFVATTQFSGVIWAKKPIMAYAVDVSYAFVAFMVMGTIWAIVL